MTAWNNARSTFYDFEREVEKGRKEVVPVHASSDRIIYTDANRTAHYEGSVKIRQGTDQIDSATADVLMDEENKLISLTASKDVVMTHAPRYRGSGRLHRRDRHRYTHRKLRRRRRLRARSGDEKPKIDFAFTRC